ncbi:CgeB family protein [Priestia megaterium]|uniref:CgeB family protein n=1 Tax=Priestia megaterium TaxID=1404 RepID=UPI0030F3F333
MDNRVIKKKGFKIVTTSPTASINEYKEILDYSKIEFIFTLMGANINKLLLNVLEQSNIPFGIWLTEDPFYIDKSLEIMSDKKIFFTIDLGAYNFYQAKGYKNVSYLPLGTNPTIFTKKEVNSWYGSDILFLGYPYPSRVSLAKLILENTNYQLTLIGKGWYRQIPKRWRRLKQLRIIDEWTPPNLASYYYNGAKLVINDHRKIDFAYNKNSIKVENKSINNRTFDISSCGAFQLVDYKEDLYNQYKEDEIIHYTSPTDCLNKINYYIHEDQLRKLISDKAQCRVATNHTIDSRISSILNFIKGI